MVYLVGGYKLTVAEARAWGKARGIDPPEYSMMTMVNRWLKANKIPTSILACSYGGENIFLFITHRKNDLYATYTNFPYFTENEHALEVKERLELDPKVPFVTVTGAYTLWGIE